MWITQDDLQRTGAAEEDCEGLVNYAVGISGVELAVFLRELPDHRIRLSLRSKNRAINVATLAEKFGGGGHESASGCTLNGPLPEATDIILAALRAALPPTPQPARDKKEVSV
jgi:phosphoesterase RecJ-like protein